MPLRQRKFDDNLMLGYVSTYTQRYTFLMAIVLVCGSVAEWLGCWTCDQQVAGSNPGLPAVECNPGQVVNTHVPLSHGVALAMRHRQ